MPLFVKKGFPQRVEKIQFRYFIYHKVLNFIAYEWSKTLKANQRKQTIASQYYIASLLDDDYLYNFRKEMSIEIFQRLYEEQDKMGMKGINTLKYLQQSTALFTKYYHVYGKNLTEVYIEDFKPIDCNDRQ